MGFFGQNPGPEKTHHPVIAQFRISVTRESNGVIVDFLSY